MQKANLGRILSICAATGAAVVTALPAFAVSVVDYSGLGTAITGELTPALTAVVPIAGTLIAVGVGWKMVRRFTK